MKECHKWFVYLKILSPIKNQFLTSTPCNDVAIYKDKHKAADYKNISFILFIINQEEKLIIILTL